VGALGGRTTHCDAGVLSTPTTRYNLVQVSEEPDSAADTLNVSLPLGKMERSILQWPVLTQPFTGWLSAPWPFR
jgi:hypothetical protein